MHFFGNDALRTFALKAGNFIMVKDYFVPQSILRGSQLLAMPGVVKRRILLSLKAVKDCAYDLKYYSKLRGFFYELQKGSRYFNLHEREGYRLFSFSSERYGEYGLQSHRPYGYWRPEHGFEPFLQQLSGNLAKKYAQCTGKKPKQASLFEQFRYEKSVRVHRIEKGREIPTVGSLWKFSFSYLAPEQKSILQVGIDAGFGELNSSGFGFVNVVRA